MAQTAIEVKQDRVSGFDVYGKEFLYLEAIKQRIDLQKGETRGNVTYWFSDCPVWGYNQEYQDEIDHCTGRLKVSAWEEGNTLVECSGYCEPKNIKEAIKNLPVKETTRPIKEKTDRTIHALDQLPEPRPLDDAFLVRYSADDAGNAESVKALFGHEILYTSAYGWLVWNGTHWEQDEQGIVQRVISLLNRHKSSTK